MRTPGSPAPSDPGARLERALELFFAHPEPTAADAARLMESNPDLRDLLEPMLGGDSHVPHAHEEQVLGDFRLVRELGRGGMGVVYEAWQRSLDRRVAVKVLASALVASPSAVARFRREAAAAGRLRHANIVEVFGFGSDAGQHFFAMQLVEGESLHTCKARFRAPHHAVDLAVQLVDALAHAHAAGLVHRDVKPANVLVCEDRRALLTDFGIASDEALPSITREGGFLGTLDYASPEQVRGGPVDARTDLWAVGVMLHELLSGAHPFTAATQEATLRNILTAEAPSLRVDRNITSDLAAVVGRALEKNPARRYASAAAMLADLRALQTGAAVSARLPSPPERVLRWARREPWRALAATTLLLGVPALTASLGYLWANAPRIEAAETAERTRAREEVLAHAWWRLHEEGAELALQTLAPLSQTDDVEVCISRAMMLLQLERVDEARAALQGFSGETVELVRTFLDQPLVKPNTTDALNAFECFVRAQMMYEGAMHRGARTPSTMRRAAEMANLAVVLAPSPRLSYLITLANTAGAIDDEHGVFIAEQALAQHFPDSPVALRVRARILVNKNPERTLQLLADEAPHAGAMANVWVTRGTAWENLRRLPEAAAANRRAIAESPGMGRAWANLGIVLRKQKDYAESVTALQKAIELQPYEVTIWNALGLTQRSRGDASAAKNAFERALELRSDYAPAAYNLGNLLIGAGDVDGAIAAFRQAVANGSDVRYVANLGDALSRAGRLQEALAVHLRAAEMAPNDLIPNYNVARTALDLGLAQLALPAAKRASEIDEKGADGLTIYADALLAQTPVDAKAALAAATEADARRKGEALDARLVLARALDASGDRAAALEMVEAAAKEPSFAGHRLRPSLDSLLLRLREAR
ncbi:MAG TPA: serine/threonine-protein kinase [Planctomycetota bacterium]|nr:serine/threonine-protein kinase [Planctomycetota bacterium]